MEQGVYFTKHEILPKHDKSCMLISTLCQTDTTVVNIFANFRSPDSVYLAYALSVCRWPIGQPTKLGYFWSVDYPSDIYLQLKSLAIWSVHIVYFICPIVSQWYCRALYTISKRLSNWNWNWFINERDFAIFMFKMNVGGTTYIATVPGS